jgi:hypothetical protein
MSGTLSPLSGMDTRPRANHILIRTTLAMKARMEVSQAARGRLWINPVQWMTVWNELHLQCLDKLLRPGRPRLEMG